MSNFNVLVVDDSAYNRKVIAEILLALPGVRVVGKAASGEEALQLAHSLNPDLITLDLEMPGMGGVAFLRLLRTQSNVPVVVVSGYVRKETVALATELGALGVVVKPTQNVTADLPLIRAELIALVSTIRAEAKDGKRRISIPPRSGLFAPLVNRTAIRLVVIGASSGGPTALVRLFRQLPADLAASVVVAQHMPARFTSAFANRLDRLSDVRVREASGVHSLREGQAWVCPGGASIEIGADAKLVVKPAGDDRYVPSIDRLFTTAGVKFGARCLGLVLTGMGDDGTMGAAVLVRHGGQVCVESEASATIFGMPGSILRAAIPAEVGTIPQLALKIRSFAGQKRRGTRFE